MPHTGPVPCRQTQNPERGRKPAKYRLHDTTTTRRQTQNPERGRKQVRVRQVRVDQVRSSDPKPREGTETGSRQTGSRRSSPVVRPKTPRGDGNILSANSSTVPLSGRQTQNPERGRKRPVDGGCVVRASVVRPKTPRGDGNPTMASKSAWVTDPGRQTQNPERGRKPDGTELSGFYQVVVRPKTPRGDGNPHGGTWTSATIGVVGPKTPRGDGNWTQNRTGCGRCSSRQTQNPERGRKRISPATPQPRYCSMSSDPKPREGTETHRR
ncbi:hypothetical protein T560_02913 [Mycobacterium tuberculosis UT0004]|nr:hypothetical protein T560_02913 [Mycobacterium tuberculosis UT0004]